MRGPGVITVAGEALIDLIVDPAVTLIPVRRRPVQRRRAVARLGQPAAFLGGLSQRQVRAAARGTTWTGTGCSADRVRCRRADHAGGRGRRPGRRTRLSLLPDGTSARRIEPGAGLLPPATTVLHIGGLGLVMEPVATTLERLVAALPGRHHGDARPELPAGRDRFAAGLHWTGSAGSCAGPTDQDQHGRPGVPIPRPGPGRRGQRTCSARGPPAWWSPTARPPARFRRGRTRSASRSRPPRSSTRWVPGTRSAAPSSPGGATGSAGPTWATRTRCAGATRAAVYASAVTCTRRGAEPPWATELAGHAGWDWLPGGR